jgi:hypothetical protein
MKSARMRCAVYVTVMEEKRRLTKFWAVMRMGVDGTGSGLCA